MKKETKFSNEEIKTFQEKSNEVREFLNELEGDIDKLIFEKFTKGELKRITNEKEYWEQHKIYKKKITKLMRKSYKFFTDGFNFIREIEILYSEMEFIGLVSEEWVQGQRERLLREMNSPYEFKMWVLDSRDKLKNSLKSRYEKIKSKVT